MKLYKKIYWKIKNEFDYLRQENLKRVFEGLPTGLLSHRKDKKDYPYLGASLPRVEKKIRLGHDFFHLDQENFNTCVWFSNTLASSIQEGKRFTPKPIVQEAKRRGKIKGNGYGSLRGGLEMSCEFGRVPWEMMPGDICGQSWEKYSRYEVTQEMKIEAAKWRSPSFHKIANAAEAIDALSRGYVLVTGLKWYTGMNRPLPPSFVIAPSGTYVGGHAICVDGVNPTPDLFVQSYENPQTFGKNYGDNGRVKIEDIFSKYFYEVYIMEKIPGRTDAQRLAGTFEGKMVKGLTPDIFVITNGKKRYIHEEEFNLSIPNVYYTVDQDLLDQVPNL